VGDGTLPFLEIQGQTREKGVLYFRDKKVASADTHLNIFLDDPLEKKQGLWVGIKKQIKKQLRRLVFLFQRGKY